MRYSIPALLLLTASFLFSCQKKYECSCVVNIEGDYYGTVYPVKETDRTEAENKCFKIEKETDQDCELR